MAIVAYLTFIGFIAAIIIHSSKKTELGAFHLRQLLGIWLTAAGASLVMLLPLVGWLLGMVLYLSVLVFWVIGFITALSGKMTPVPVLGSKYQEWFAGVFT